MPQAPDPLHRPPSTRVACRLVIGGQVQGVGFRPFVYRLARDHGLAGEVRNLRGRVEIRLEGPPAGLEAFRQALFADPPALARPRLIEDEAEPPRGCRGFRILPSAATGPREHHLPPDLHVCSHCLRELEDPADRRHRYPFINCTQCGPRYTLIAGLPWDRAATAMAGFPLCPACRREYEDPASRRFHAEPVACPDCGPRLRWTERERHCEDTAAALEAAAGTLRAGGIVAVKGVGGYHLLCDAGNHEAVLELRRRKARPHKPLAVLFPFRGADGLAAVRQTCEVPPGAATVLTGPARPIVLCPVRAGHRLSPAIAPGLDEIGVMLPYSPLHHLLSRDFGGPLVATSANPGGEPVLTDAVEAESRLGAIADGFLHHDRPILRPADDSVLRPAAGACRPLRLGRGIAPLELPLELPGSRALAQPLLAVGGHMRCTVALAWDRRMVVSPHIGDLHSPRGLDVFARVIADLQALYGVEAQWIVCDRHPGYASHRWARRSGLPVQAVYHHHAHAAQLAAEFPEVARWLVFTWDGTGYGEDGTLWGGEALLGRPGRWRRVASLRPFRLPGGEQAAREPWRSALGLCWEAGIEWRQAPARASLLHQAWRCGLNSPRTSAAGRLFDGAAALTGLLREASWEGQAPALLEAAARGIRAEPLDLPLQEDPEGVWRGDWAPLLPELMDPVRPAAERAACFHASLARLLVEQACRVRECHGDFVVGLSGGVFQNRLLTGLAATGLEAAGFGLRIPRRVPVNDGGLCVGQVLEAAARHPGSPP